MLIFRDQQKNTQIKDHFIYTKSINFPELEFGIYSYILLYHIPC